MHLFSSIILGDCFGAFHTPYDGVSGRHRKRFECSRRPQALPFIVKNHEKMVVRKLIELKKLTILLFLAWCGGFKDYKYSSGRRLNQITCLNYIFLKKKIVFIYCG